VELDAALEGVGCRSAEGHGAGVVYATQEDVAMGCCMRCQKALHNSLFFAST
jgi:hypothetical protein